MSASQLGSGLLGGEFPLDPGTGRVALLLPNRDLGGENIMSADAAIQALAAHHADLDLSHVQPTCVLGRVVKFQAL